MTDELMKLRHEVYSSAAFFHEAMSKYFSALKDDAAAVQDAASVARKAGVAYNATLVALLKHLKSLPSNPKVNVEAEQAERTISILSFEIRRL
ncbi:MAG TPA: hypothetical protein VF543_12200 [Pyrinomonadaceae bacterium]|jgi:hydrogenase maturation factor HypF (carbamoyltransferase family)